MATSTASPRRWLLILGGIAGAAILLYAAFGLGTDDPAVAEVAGEPTIEGDALPTLPDGNQDPAAGQPAPVVEGSGFDGESMTIGEDGTELVMFVASWCPACQEELPMVVDWLEADSLPDDVELKTVVTGLDDTRPNWPPQDWLEREDFDQPVLVDDAEGSVATAYGMSATPFWMALQDGEVVGRVAGVLEPEQLDEFVGMLTEQ